MSCFPHCVIALKLFSLIGPVKQVDGSAYQGAFVSFSPIGRNSVPSAWGQKLKFSVEVVINAIQNRYNLPDDIIAI